MSVTNAPFYGAKTTVDAIRDAILNSQGDYRIRVLAERICGNLRPKDYVSEALAIYNYVCTNVRYMRDPRTVELVKEIHIPVEQLLNGQTPQLDCDDLTALIAGLILSTGGSCRLVTVAFRDVVYQGDQQFSHIFIQVMEPRTKVWFTLDPVAGPLTDKMLKQAVVAKIWPIA